jgi:hypothetical protein
VSHFNPLCNGIDVEVLLGVISEGWQKVSELKEYRKGLLINSNIGKSVNLMDGNDRNLGIS